MPQPLPAHGCATRIQQELSASFLPSRSQWNCTFTRPYLSVKISSPAGPTTTAVCVPSIARRRRYPLRPERQRQRDAGRTGSVIERFPVRASVDSCCRRGVVHAR